MSFWLSLQRRWRRPPPVPDELWSGVLRQHAFLASLDPSSQVRLRELCGHFLAEKEFHGAHGLQVTDSMALAIAAQACRPLLNMCDPLGRRVAQPSRLLAWYDDFVGIVVQPGAALARREVRDQAGVVHQYTEALAGEAMDGGPLMLSWEDVANADARAEMGHNVVIHEFVHKMDMRDMALGEHPDGAPPLPQGFMGTRSRTDAAERWRTTMNESYEQFREAVALAERFGGEPPWLDAYASTHPAEFFAVTCEAYFVNPGRFASEFPTLKPLYDGFFNASTTP